MDLVNAKFHPVKQFIPVDCPVTPGLTPKSHRRTHRGTSNTITRRSLLLVEYLTEYRGLTTYGRHK